MTQLKGDLNGFRNYFNYLFYLFLFSFEFTKDITTKRKKHLKRPKKLFWSGFRCMHHPKAGQNTQQKEEIGESQTCSILDAHYRMTSHYLSRNKAKLKYHFKVGFYGWLSVAISSWIENLLKTKKQKSWKKWKKLGVLKLGRNTCRDKKYVCTFKAVEAGMCM